MSDIEMHKTFELALSDLKKNGGSTRSLNAREWFITGWQACAAYLPQQPVAGKVTDDVVKDARFFLRVHSARQGNRETFIEALILIKQLSNQLVSQPDVSRDEGWTSDLSQQSALLGGLLAVIHRDGGHYQSHHGASKACQDAGEIVFELFRKLEERQVAADNVPLGWAFEVLKHGLHWTQQAILNRPGGGANPPKKFNGQEIRNIIPFYAPPHPATSRDEKLSLIKFCLEKAPGVTETYCPPHEEILAAFEDSQKDA